MVGAPRQVPHDGLNADVSTDEGNAVIDCGLRAPASEPHAACDVRRGEREVAGMAVILCVVTMECEGRAFGVELLHEDFGSAVGPLPPEDIAGREVLGIALN